MMIASQKTHPPLANDDSFSTNEDTAITFTAAQLLGNDTDADGDTLVITGVNSSSLLGQLEQTIDGTFTYNPNGAVREPQ